MSDFDIEGMCTAKAETAHAVLVITQFGKVWVPKSVLRDSSEIKKRGDTGKLVVSQRWAEKIGLDKDKVEQESQPGIGPCKHCTHSGNLRCKYPLGGSRTGDNCDAVLCKKCNVQGYCQPHARHLGLPSV